MNRTTDREEATMEKITDAEALSKIALALDTTFDDHDLRRTVAEAVAQSGRGPFAVSEDSNGVRRDASGRALGCTCAEHGEECGECAEDRECLGHPAEDCGPAGEHAAIGDVFYCDGSCRAAV